MRVTAVRIDGVEHSAVNRPCWCGKSHVVVVDGELATDNPSVDENGHKVNERGERVKDPECEVCQRTNGLMGDLHRSSNTAGESS